MTADHAARAVELTEQAEDPDFGAERPLMLASAQVHAILALAEAVGRLGVQRPRWDDDLREMEPEAGGDESCGQDAGFGECHRREHGDDTPHGTLIGGGSDPVGGDPEVWFLWSAQGKSIGYRSAKVLAENWQAPVDWTGYMAEARSVPDPTFDHPITVAGQPAEERGKP